MSRTQQQRQRGGGGALGSIESTNRVAMVAVPISAPISRSVPSFAPSTLQAPRLPAATSIPHGVNAALALTMTRATGPVDKEMKSLSSFRRGGWKKDGSANLSEVNAKIDTGRSKPHRRGISQQINSYIIPTDAQQSQAKAKVNDNAAASSSSSASAPTKILTATNEALIKFLGDRAQQPKEHTPFVRASADPTPTISSSPSVASLAVDHTSSTSSLYNLPFGSPRTRKIHQAHSHADQERAFTNSHHFDATYVPPPPPAFTVPSLPLPPQSAKPAGEEEQKEKQYPATERSGYPSHGLATSSSTASTSRLVYDPSNSTIKQLPLDAEVPQGLQAVASTARLHQNESQATLHASSSVTSLYGAKVAIAAASLAQSPSTVSFTPAAGGGSHTQSIPNLAAIMPNSLAPSASVGHLPYGMSPSASHAQIHASNGSSKKRRGLGLGAHVHSSPSMPRFSNQPGQENLHSHQQSTGSFGLNSDGSMGQSILGSAYGSTTTLNHSPSSQNDLSAAAATFSEYTVDNSALIASYLKQMIRDKGYRYRAKGKGMFLDGHMDASSEDMTDEEERVERRIKRRARREARQQQEMEHAGSATARNAADNSKQQNENEGSRTARPPRAKKKKDKGRVASWDKKGLQSIAAQMPFEALFGLDDSAAKIRKRKREKRLEEERARRDSYVRHQKVDDETLRIMREGDVNTAQQLTAAAELMAAVSGSLEKEASSGTSGDGKSIASNILVPTDLIQASSVSTAALGHYAPGVDPLVPREKPTLVSAAAKVLLFKEIHETGIDANTIRVSKEKPKPSVDFNSTASTKQLKGLHELVSAKIEDAEEKERALLSPLVENMLPTSGGKFFDAVRARGTFLEHSSRVYNFAAGGSGARVSGAGAAASQGLGKDGSGAGLGAHGSHSVQTYIAQQNMSKRDLKTNMERWLRVRARRHQKILNEEERLHAREMFDMLVLAAGGPHASSSSNDGGTSKARRAAARDPAGARIELESMRRALHSLGMEASNEELAFRLQKLSELHERNRAAAAVGATASKVKGVAGKTATKDYTASRKASTTSSPTRSSETSPTRAANIPSSSLYLTFSDFLTVYEHISSWDELLTYRRVKEQKAKEEAAHPPKRLMSRNSSLALLDRKSSSAPSNPASNVTSPSGESSSLVLAGGTNDKRKGKDGVFHITVTMSPRSGDRQLVRSPMSPNNRNRKLAKGSKETTPYAVARSLNTAVAPFEMPADLLSPQRPLDALKKVELPFFLWVPAAHRSNNIDNIIHQFGQPSRVGVQYVQMDEEEEGNANNINSAQTEKETTSKKAFKRSRLLAPRRKSRANRARTGSVTTGGSGSGTKQVSASEGVDSSEEGSSSTDEEEAELVNRDTILAPDAPHNIVRNLLDALNPRGLTPRISTATIEEDKKKAEEAEANKQGILPALITSLKSPKTSPTSKSSSTLPSPHSVAPTPRASSGLPKSPRKGSVKLKSKPLVSPQSTSPGKSNHGGGYWGSQQVLRALHFKNMAMSSSTISKNRVLTHEHVAPTVVVSGSPVLTSATLTASTSPTSGSATPIPRMASTPRTTSAAGGHRKSVFVPPLNLGRADSGRSSPMVGAVLEDGVHSPPVPLRPLSPLQLLLGNAGVHVADIHNEISAGANRTAKEIEQLVAEVERNMLVRAEEAAALERKEQKEAQMKEEKELFEAQVRLRAEQAAAHAAAVAAQKKADKLARKNQVSPTSRKLRRDPNRAVAAATFVEDVLQEKEAAAAHALELHTAPAAAAPALGSFDFNKAKPTTVGVAPHLAVSARAVVAEKSAIARSSSKKTKKNTRRDRSPAAKAQTTRSKSPTSKVSQQKSGASSTRRASMKQLPEAPVPTTLAVAVAVEPEKAVPAPEPIEEEKPDVMPLTDPMIKASKSGAWEDVLMLIQTNSGDDVKLRTAYVNRRDKNGSSAIFHCVWPGHFKVLEVLLYHGADPNIQNNRLNTALHLCTEKGHRRLIRLLIETGASIELKNWQNKTCLDVIPIETAQVTAAVAQDDAITVIPAGSSASAEPSSSQLISALRTHAAEASTDSLKAFVIECAQEAKRKKEQEKASEMSSLNGIATIYAAPGENFADFSNRRDAAAAANYAASIAAASLSLLGPDGKPAVDLWALTAEDRRSAGIRGNFFGADSLQNNGQTQSKTLTGQLLIHSAESARGFTANQNAMGAYKESFLASRVSDPSQAAETRARIVAGLVREELAHSSLHELWKRTQKVVSSRATVISNPDELLQQQHAKMEQLREKNLGREDLLHDDAVVAIEEEPN